MKEKRYKKGAYQRFMAFAAITLFLIISAKTVASAGTVGYYPASGTDIYYAFEATDADEFVFMDSDPGGYFGTVEKLKADIELRAEQSGITLGNLQVKKLESGAGYNDKFEITFDYKSKPRKVIFYRADAQAFFPPEAKDLDYYLLKAPTGYNPSPEMRAKIYKNMKQGGTFFSSRAAFEDFHESELVGFEKLADKRIGEANFVSTRKVLDYPVDLILKILKTRISSEGVMLYLERQGTASHGYIADNEIEYFKSSLNKISEDVKTLPKEIQKDIADVLKKRVIEGIGVDQVSTRISSQADRERLISETNKLFDDFLRDLGLLASAAVKAIRITESSIEVLQADGTTKTYNSHAEFTAAPAADRTIGGKELKLVNGYLEINGEEVYIGHMEYFDGTSGKTTLTGEVTDVNEIIVKEVNGKPQYELNVQRIDRDGITKGRAFVDEAGTVIQVEPIEGTSITRMGKVRTFLRGLRNKGVLVSKGAEYVGVFGHGTILAVAVVGLANQDWKWVVPEAVTDVITGALVSDKAMSALGRKALSLGKANLIGTIIGSGIELGLYSWEERSANQIKEEFGIDETSNWDSIKGGLGRMSSSYRDFFKLFASPERPSMKAFEDYITDTVDTYFVNIHNTAGNTITPEQKKQLIEQILGNTHYSQKFYDKIIKPMVGSPYSALFVYYTPNEAYQPASSPQDLSKIMEKGMCELLEEMQKDKELQKIGIYTSEKDMKKTLEEEFTRWDSMLLDCQNEYAKAKKTGTLPDAAKCDIGIDGIEADTQGNTLLIDNYFTGKGSAGAYMQAEAGREYISQLKGLMGGLSCEDLAKDLQYRVFVKNNYEEDVTCDMGVNTGMLKWEIKTGTNCKTDQGYADITSLCKENPSLKVELNTDVEAFCTSDQLKEKYPKKKGPYCLRITWCGSNETFNY